MRTRRQQNYWPSDKEFLEQIIDNPARTNEPKKRWEATLIVGILIIFSKIIFLLLPLGNHNWIFKMRFLFTVLYDMSRVLLFLIVCALGVFTSYFWRVSKLKKTSYGVICTYEISCLEAVRRIKFAPATKLLSYSNCKNIGIGMLHQY